MSLSSIIENFIRTRRNFDGCGHEKKYLFDCTSPFTDVEGLRFSAITNSPYDFLDYKPTSEHLFLRDDSLQSFESYVSRMFATENEWNDWCYFRIFKKLLPHVFANVVQLMKQGRFKRVKPPSDYKMPLCMIPIIEYQTLENFSQVYTVKAACASLEKTKIRLKLNTYFMALQRLLGCSESEIIDVLVKYGVLPSRNFTLISTQKEVTIGCSLFKKSGLEEKLGSTLVAFENQGVLFKPMYAIGNQNLHQTLMYLFNVHPLYKECRGNLTIQTEIEEDGKGRLLHARPNNKRKYTENPRDQSNLPKKWKSNTEVNNNKGHTVIDITPCDNSEHEYTFEQDVCLQCPTSSSDIHYSNIQQIDILAEAMKLSGIPTLNMF